MERGNCFIKLAQEDPSIAGGPDRGSNACVKKRALSPRVLAYTIGRTSGEQRLEVRNDPPAYVRRFRIAATEMSVPLRLPAQR